MQHMQLGVTTPLFAVTTAVCTEKNNETPKHFVIKQTYFTIESFDFRSKKDSHIRSPRKYAQQCEPVMLNWDVKQLRTDVKICLNFARFISSVVPVDYLCIIL